MANLHVTVQLSFDVETNWTVNIYLFFEEVESNSMHQPHWEKGDQLVLCILYDVLG